MFRVIRIWTITVHGEKSRITVRFGIRARWKWAGLLIAMDTGTGLARGAGPGWIMSHGALRHFTMDAGRLSAAVGAGALGPWMHSRFTDQRSSVLWAGVDLALGSGAGGGGGAGGSRWGVASRS